MTTDSGGNFSVTGSYYDQCNADTDIVYLLATNGSSGGTNNAQLSLVALLPYDCGQLNSLQPTVYVSDFTNLAAAFALQSFANSPTVSPLDGFATKVSASVTANATAFNAAIVASQNIASTLTGTYAISDANVQKYMNTIADVVATCIESNGGTSSSTACGRLFSATTPSGSTVAPVDTWQAILSMGQNPTNNVSNQFNLISATAPYQPNLTFSPASWNLPIVNGPTITSLSENSGNTTTSITISGSYLVSGTTTPIVVVNGLNAPVAAGFTASSVTVHVPTTSSLGAGFVQVYPGTYASNAVPFTVTR